MALCGAQDMREPETNPVAQTTKKSDNLCGFGLLFSIWWLTYSDYGNLPAFSAEQFFFCST
jgi:hypothetical protein